jgi:hypothetical protein
MGKDDSSYRKKALRWLERYSHFDTIWGAFSSGGPVRTTLSWIAEASLFKNAVAMLTAVVLGGWAWVIDQPGPIVATITLGAFALVIWILNGIIWSYRRFLRRELPKNVDIVQPDPQEIDPDQRVFQGIKVRLPDLLRGGSKNIISDKVFIDCDIYGSAVVGLMGPFRHNHFKDVSIDGNAETTFIVATPPTNMGIISLDNVQVIGGTFRNVIFIGDHRMITAARQQFK